jgi:hypothetical protein
MPGQSSWASGFWHGRPLAQLPHSSAAGVDLEVVVDQRVVGQLHEVSAIQQYPWHCPWHCPLHQEREKVEDQGRCFHVLQVAQSYLEECCFFLLHSAS